MSDQFVGVLLDELIVQWNRPVMDRGWSSMEMAEMREDGDDDEADEVELHVDDSSFKGHCEPRVLSMPVMQI